MNAGDLWVGQGVLYEIYIRSFFDHSGDGVGDFRGISEKMEYIARLGVKGIILNCPFQSFPGNTRHPLTDWMRTDPRIGTLSDLLMVIENAHLLGLKVILSLPVNATSDRHVWFLESKDRSSRHLRKSYFWSDRLKFSTSPSQNIPEMANWAQDEETGQYYWYQDHKDEPALNFGDPEIQEEIRRVFVHWLTLDVDGFRLSGSGRLHRIKKNEIELITDPFRQFQPILDPLKLSFPDKVFLLESGIPPRGRLAQDPRLYFHFNSFFPSVVNAIRSENKESLDQILKAGDREHNEMEDPPIRRTLDLRERSEETFEKFVEDGGEAVFPLEPTLPEERPILSRIARVMENGRRRIQLAVSLFLTSPGIPVLYYGDEIGMGDHPHLLGRNPIRTPMQWSSDRNAGFSKVDPEELYNPVIDDPLYSYTMVNVESQERFSDSHLWHLRRMIEVRNRQGALASRGKFGLVESEHPSVFAFTRRSAGEVCLLVHNLSKDSVCGNLHLSSFAGLVPQELFGEVLFPRIKKYPYLVTMTPYSFIWFKLLQISP
ncbi:MAG: alpha-amylase family glycosyl hydrolase [Leptospirales bacterium]